MKAMNQSRRIKFVYIPLGLLILLSVVYLGLLARLPMPVPSDIIHSLLGTTLSVDSASVTRAVCIDYRDWNKSHEPGICIYVILVYAHNNTTRSLPIDSLALIDKQTGMSVPGILPLRAEITTYQSSGANYPVPPNNVPPKSKFTISTHAIDSSQSLVKKRIPQALDRLFDNKQFAVTIFFHGQRLHSVLNSYEVQEWPLIREYWETLLNPDSCAKVR